jgi:hypothetical protein
MVFKTRMLDENVRREVFMDPPDDEPRHGPRYIAVIIIAEAVNNI